jgi:predicted SPOUT superfamily RNA methylase MTH1
LAERRRNRLSIAIPASMVSEHGHLRDKTEALGRVGRAAAIYRVEEIIVYPDQPDESTLMKYILGYIETPQYLRKHLFDKRPELRYVGTLPPLRTPHHPLEDRVEKGTVGEAREGVVTNMIDGGYMVDVGLDRLMEVKGRAPSRGSRVTVQIVEKEPSLRGRPVKKSRLSRYWGYDLRGSNYRLCELALSPEWDLTIATSRRGDDFNSAAPEMSSLWAESRRTLVAFGSHSEGVYEIIGRESKRAEECFRFILNTVPGQGTETVRTEEAIHATLALLNTFKD